MVPPIFCNQTRQQQGLEDIEEAETVILEREPSDVPPVYNLADKEWQNLQRDCCLFPAYTDALYGPDMRSVNNWSPVNETHHTPVNEIRPLNFGGGESQRQSMLQTPTSTPRRPNNFPQLRGITRSPDPSPCPVRPSVPVSITPAQMRYQLRSRSSQNAVASQFLRDSTARQGESVPSDAQNTHPTTPEAQNAQIPQPNVSPDDSSLGMLRPTDLLTHRYVWIQPQSRQAIDNEVTALWTRLRDAKISHNEKGSVLTQLRALSDKVRTEERMYFIRTQWIPRIWELLKVKQQFPQESREFQQAHHQLLGIKNSLTPQETDFISQSIQTLTEAANGSRQPASK